MTSTSPCSQMQKLRIFSLFFKVLTHFRFCLALADPWCTHCWLSVDSHLLAEHIALWSPEFIKRPKPKHKWICHAFPRWLVAPDSGLEMFSQLLHCKWVLRHGLMTSLEKCNANHILLYSIFFHTVFSTTTSRKKEHMNKYPFRRGHDFFRIFMLTV